MTTHSITLKQLSVRRTNSSGVALLCVVFFLSACGNESNSDSNSSDTSSKTNATDTTTSTPNPSLPNATESRTARNHSDNSLVGEWKIIATPQVTLANESVRFPDKNPHGVAATGPDAEKRKRAIEQALMKSTWQFESDGKVVMTWMDPALGNRIELKGSWREMFGQLNVQLSNPVITTKLPDGSPNSPVSFSLTCTKPTRDNRTILAQGNFFHAPTGHMRSTGHCSLTLQPR